MLDNMVNKYRVAAYLVRFLFFVSCCFLLHVEANAQIIQSENDQRDYRYLELENGLRVVLISDPQANKAAASLDVNVGSGDDPADRPGLAHFLEHMLFLGTEKYPQAGEYQGFISQHGGSHNAYTSQNHTNYFFDVDIAFFQGALDRFSQFFVAPLFTAKYVGKERNAVHSEYQAKIQNEYRRAFDVIAQVVNPQHPAAHFSVGSLETLADRPDDAVRDDLLAFYQRYYSASNMRLAVLGPQSLDELQAMVVSRFTGIKQFAVKFPKEPPMFLPGSLPKALFVEPLKDFRSLSLVFPIPDISAYYQQKPTEYIGNLLGHEGEGSLLSALKNLGWAEGLSAGASEDGREAASFMVSMTLTPEGEKHVDEILSLVFEAVNKIDRKGLNKWRYKEQQTMGEMAFRYQEKQDPMSTVSRLSNAMQQYSVEDYLRGGYLFEHFDKALIADFLGYLRPDNMLVVLTSPSVKTDQTSPYYSTPYRVGSVEEFYQPNNKETVESVSQHYDRKNVSRTSKRLKHRIILPKPNPFIPKHLQPENNVVDKDAGPILPQQLVKADNLAIWYAPDDQFAVPKADVHVRFLSPAAAQSVVGAAQAEIYVAMLNDQLNEFSYPASLAGLNFSLSATNRGFDLEVQGFSDRQAYLLDEILATMKKPAFTALRFEQLQAEQIRQWRNRKLQPPFRQLFDQLPVTLYEPYWSLDELADALAALTFPELEAFAGKVFAGAEVSILAHGDRAAKIAHELRRPVESLIDNASASEVLAKARVIKLAPKESWHQTLGMSHPDRAAVWYLQGKDDSLQDKAHMLVLRQALQAPFYEHLRTEKQLGYIVGAYPMPIKEVPGTVLVVQSPSATLQTVVDSMREFIDGFVVAPEKIDVFKQAVLTELMTPPQNLFQQGQEYWSNILRQRQDFAWKEQVIKAVNNISVASFNRYLEDVAKSGRRSVLLTTDQQLKVLNARAIKSVAEFKEGHSAYSYP